MNRMNFKKILIGGAAGALMLGALAVSAFAAGGFNQYGYNYGARIFNGTYLNYCISGQVKSGVDPVVAQTNCEASLGNFKNDKLVMKWNAAWDACNANGYDNPAYCLGAWVDNEFNGNVPNGSGEMWHYKIIWVGSAGQSSQYWLPGGYSVWGNYEVIMDQGVDKNINYDCSSDNNGGHQVCALATPNGYGAVFSH